MSEHHLEHLPVVEGFLRYLIDERHFSPYTSRCYGVDLRQFIDHLAEELNITPNRQHEAETFQRRQNSQQKNYTNGEVVGKVGPATVTKIIFDADVNVIRAFLARLDEHH